MKISKSKGYAVLFAIIIFLQLYLPSFKMNIALQLAVLLLYFSLEKIVVNKLLLQCLVPTVLIFFIGFIGTITHHYQIVDIVKDISHFLKPITGLLVGYFLFSKNGNFKLFIQTVVVTGVVSAALHFLIILLFTHDFSVSGIREFGKDNFLEFFAIFFLIFYKKLTGDDLFQRKRFRIYFVLLLLSNLLYLSRTMIITALFITMTVYGYSKLNAKAIRILLFGIAVFAGFYAYLFTLKLDRNKGFESFLYKIQMAPAEIFESKIDRENHVDLWDHWRAYEAKRALFLMENNPESFIYGTGQGSVVNLKFYAPLTENYKDKGMKYISELHNGYIFVLYKTGIIGILIYLGMLITLYRKIYEKRNMVTIFISAIGLIYFFTTLIITGIYNGRDIIIFLLGAMIAFYYKDIKSEQNATT
ncbi:O-antigen ligase family protein [Flavobacterium sp. 3HN19-14]|uniref:O-antigen ligase family protein n=1 Tax=Flavobacterium sp. 3HN19-14 TaxID=3448133 RepID=UPI003EE1CD25